MITRAALAFWLSVLTAWAGCGNQRPPAQRFVFAPGLSINYEVHGSGETTILALHGLGASLDSWRDILPVLTRYGTVYLVDLIGYGHSTKPAKFRYSVDSEADVVEAFRSHLESQGRTDFVLLGHSLGGAVALELAARKQVEMLILIDPLVSFDSIRLHLLVSTFNQWPFNRLALAAVPARQRAWIGLRRAFKNNSQVDDERVCRYAQFLDMPGANRAFLKTVQAMRLTKVRDGLGAIQCPVFVIWGDKDPILSPSEGDHLAKALPNATLVRIPHCGHVPHEEWPAETAFVIGRALSNRSHRV